MSFFNFLNLSDEGYEGFAKGILYVVCEIFWKVMHAVGSLIDVITGLFYKLTGANYLGSGNETLVEEQDLLSKLFNQNIVSNVSFFMIILSFSLMMIFGVSAIVKQLYFSKDERKPMLDVIKNMILAFIFLICLTPLALFAISSMSTITSVIASIFGGSGDVSLADMLFDVSFSGNAIDAYNNIYGAGNDEWVSITSWTEMENNLLFDMEYGGMESGIEFYWYIFLLGGGVVLYNLIVMMFKLIKRIFNVIILYITGPVYVARMVDDGGAKFKEWKNKALGELISVVGTVIAFMILISLISVINDIEIVAISAEAAGEVGSVGEAVSEELVVNDTALLINSLTKILLIMAGTSVAKDSGELLGNVFSGSNEEVTLLEGLFNKVGTRESTVTTRSSETTTPRTRVITRNTTSTRRVINYNEVIPSSGGGEKPAINVVNNNRNTFNSSVNKIDRTITNIQNRSSINVNDADTNKIVHNSNVKSANFRDLDKTIGNINKPTDILNQQFVNTVKNENNKLRGEWEFIKGNNSASSKEVVKEFEGASKSLDESLKTGEPARIKDSMNRYVEAYRKEERDAKDNYRDFAGKSTKLSNDLSAKQQEELKKISSAYRKAQVDYTKTARKLNEVSQGNMSTTDALRVKENADKQRAKLMEASSKANNFYNNLKKGE